MTSLKFDEVFSCFLSKVTDYDYLNLSIDDTTAILAEKLKSVLSDPYVRRLFSSINIDDELMTISYKLEQVVDDSTDRLFIIEILAKGMVIEWLQPQVKSRVNIAQMFGGKEQKWFSQAQHISELRGLLEDAELDLRKTIRDRGYIYNSYLSES